MEKLAGYGLMTPEGTRLVEEFHWIESGRGESVVLLHGLLGAPDHWEATLAALSRGWRGLALRLPIFDLPADDLSIRRLATHVREFLDAQRIAPAVVVGNALGGHVALDLALRHPDRVRALVLTGSSGLLERSFSGEVPHRPSEAHVRSAKHENLEERLGEVRCPTRFVPNCGHAPMLGQPAAFAEHVTEFLDTLPGLPTSVA